MESIELWLICVSAFVMVFALLSVLAILMKVTTTIFSQNEVGIDATTVAAISTAVLSVSPYASITKIEEIK